MLEGKIAARMARYVADTIRDAHEGIPPQTLAEWVCVAHRLRIGLAFHPPGKEFAALACADFLYVCAPADPDTACFCPYEFARRLGACLLLDAMQGQVVSAIEIEEVADDAAELLYPIDSACDAEVEPPDPNPEKNAA